MKLVSLRAQNGKYVGVASNARLMADKDTLAQAATFEMGDISGSNVGLRSGSAIWLKFGDKFVCAEEGGQRELVANRNARYEWETFTIYDVDGQGIRPGGKIALRSYHGQFVCAEGGGGREVLANRADRSTWETFTLESRERELIGPAVPSPLMVDGVFEGGGALGVAYVGALRALETHGIWFRRVAGNSAGAITACMIAAGLTASEIEFMAAPLGLRERPQSLARGLNPIPGSALSDLPRNAAEIPQSIKRNNMLHYLLRGWLVDDILNASLGASPNVTPYVDAIMAAIPNSLQSPAFRYTVSNQKFSVTIPFRLPPGYSQTFDWTAPNFGIDIPAGQVSVDLSPHKTAIRNAVVSQLNALAAAARTGASAATLPAARMAFADGVMDRLLNEHSFARAFYNLLGTFGVYKGDVILQHLKDTLSKKLGGTAIRFRDLPLPLAVIATDMTNKRIEVYSTERTPTMEVAEAVRRSLSVPTYFSARVQDGVDYVDGGVLENYPVWLHLIGGARNSYVTNTEQDLQRVKLAFAVDSELDLAAGAECSRHSSDETDNPIIRMADRFAGGLIERQFVKRMNDLLAAEMNGSAMGEEMLSGYTKDFKLHEIKIPLKGYNWLDFDMDEAEFLGMCCRGWSTAAAVIKAKSLSPFQFFNAPKNPYTSAQSAPETQYTYVVNPRNRF